MPREFTFPRSFAGSGDIRGPLEANNRALMAYINGFVFKLDRGELGSNVVRASFFNESGYGAIEFGGTSGAYLDFKNAKGDDFDMRLILTGNDELRVNGGQFYVAGTLKADAIEGGTWTPVLGATTTNPSFTYLDQTGTYVKLGQLVIARFDIGAGTVTSSGVGSYVINGRPFAPNADVASWSTVGYGMLLDSSAGFHDVHLRRRGSSSDDFDMKGDFDGDGDSEDWNASSKALAINDGITGVLIYETDG